MGLAVELTEPAVELWLATGSVVALGELWLAAERMVSVVELLAGPIVVMASGLVPVPAQEKSPSMSSPGS
jgi:hypothetical protein